MIPFVQTRLIYVMLTAVAALALVVPAAAQEPVATSTPTFEEIVLEAQRLRDEFVRREREKFDFANYTVIYLTEPDTPDADWIASPQNIAERFSARVVHTWAEIEQILLESAIDILFIHASALDVADGEWVRAAHRNGTMMVGLSVPFESFTALVGDNCAKNENPFVPEQWNEWFLYPIYWARLSRPERKSIVDAAVLDDCDGRFGVGASVTHGAAFLPLDRRTGGVDYIAAMLRMDIIDRKFQRILMPSKQATLSD